MRILITGGSGLVGRSIHRLMDNHFCSENVESFFMRSNQCDLRNYNSTYTFISEYQPDVIIHLAACVGGLYKNINNRRSMFEDNFSINFNVLKIAYELNIKKVISCLSTCVFPDAVSYPLTEDTLHSGEPHSSNYPYAYSKRFLEIQSRIYNELGRSFICLIPTNMYGKCDNFSLEDGHVIPSLIHKFYNAMTENNPEVSIRGDGSALRQFLYVDDFARIILNFIQNKSGKGVDNSNGDSNTFIISPNIADEISIMDVAILISKYVGFKGKIIKDTSFSNGQFKKTASNQKLRKSFPNFQFTSVDNGLETTIQWFISQYPNLRLK